ncbi:hypothetical protein ASF72_15775 [Arthrobacter sp. Leaf141]|nr:hypothetical protein ASF72_15775 [Arthrobacter sp. Leaf141]
MSGQQHGRRRTPRGQGLTLRPPARFDAVDVLTIGMILSCAIPSNLTISALGSIGRPGLLWFLGALLWWGWQQVQRPFPLFGGSQPARRSLFMFLCAVAVTYAVANFAGLAPDEARAADTGLLRALSWAGLFLLANDGVIDRGKLLVLLDRVVLLGTAMATLGLVQFVTGQSFVSAISIPGFSEGVAADSIHLRAGFLRAAGTATHPLEYGVVLCMSLPIAVTLALNELKGRSIFRWICVGIILAAVALSVSRSTFIGVAVVLIVLLPSWSRTLRLRALLVFMFAGVAVYFLVPGMVGTVRGLFEGLSGDSSTQSRTDSYGVVLELAIRNGILGRGFGTFLPKYRILDNEYLLMLIDSGFLGLFTFLLFMLSGLYCCFRARALLTDPLLSRLSIAVASALTAAGVMFAFFDALSFPMAGAFLFLMLGIAGALWRIARNEKASTVVLQLPRTDPIPERRPVWPLPGDAPLNPDEERDLDVAKH